MIGPAPDRPNTRRLTSTGVYVWTSRADADRLYNGEWRAFVEKKFGSPPTIDFLDSPVMIDNRAGRSAA
jgi:hypothetical protein